MPSEEKSSPITFPCDFVVKIMGRANTSFEEQVLNIILRHFPNNKLDHINKRISRDKNYLALSITVYAENQAQLDGLYKELSQSNSVLFAL